MELLVGVEHDPEYLSGLEKLLNERFPTGIDSMMVEIPSDFDILRTALPSIYGHVDDLYFFCLDNFLWNIKFVQHPSMHSRDH